MPSPLENLIERHPDEVRAILNLLIEAPYFYRTDNEEAFFFLRRHRSEFARFYEQFYGWSLFMDAKCARVYKSRWYNGAITESNRDLFGFRRRDECIGFMILLEFFEHRLEENAMTVEDRENLRFRFGDLLEYVARRFVELFPGDTGQRYTEDFVRAEVLRRILPTLERYRFLLRLPPPEDLRIAETDTIYEALPALYHYNAARLSRAVHDTPADGPDDGADPAVDADVPTTDN